MNNLNKSLKIMRDKILGITPTEVGSKEVISAQELIDQVFAHFKYRLNESSTTMSLLFPTSFLVWLHPDDFRARQQEFPFRAKDIKKQCMKEVRSQIQSHPDWQDYEPHSKYWKIQFMEWKPAYFTADGQSGNAVVERGRATITSDLYAIDDIADAISASGNGKGGRVVTTVTNARGTTTPQYMAFNHGAIKDVTAMSQNVFRVEFLRGDLAEERKTQTDPPKPPTPTPTPSKSSIGPAAQNKPISATLQIIDTYFIVNEQKTDKLTIGTTPVQITGPNASNDNAFVQTIRIDDDSIMNPHLNIRFEPANHRFLISAVGDTKLNSKSLVKDDKNWSELPSNSAILLNGDIQINFNINR